jgi:hypothetical protein
MAALPHRGGRPNELIVSLMGGNVEEKVPGDCCKVFGLHCSCSSKLDPERKRVAPMHSRTHWSANNAHKFIKNIHS